MFISLSEARIFTKYGKGMKNAMIEEKILETIP